MGVSISRYTELTNNDLLIRLCSNEVILPNEPFWNQMLAFNIEAPSNPEEQLVFDSCAEPLLQNFLVNNPQTGNLGSLVQVFITRATELLASPSLDNPLLSWQTFNALFVIRVIIKYLVEMVPEYQLNEHLDIRPRMMGNSDGKEKNHSSGNQGTEPLPGPSSSEVSSSPKLEKTLSVESRLEMLSDALVGLVCDVPVTDNTYYLHLECINTLLVLMSVYMFANVHGQARLVESSLIYRTLFQGRYGLHAPLLVRTLLINFASLQPAPSNMFGCVESGGSIVLNLASGLWNMLTFSSGTSRRQTIITNPPADRKELMERLLKEHPLANQSCLLLLALTNHCMTEDNLYRRALLCCEDSADPPMAVPKDGKNNPSMAPPRIEMAMLHKALCATASSEHTTLLLYLMLHSCKSYKRHVYTSTDIDTLILPVLQSLYNAPDNTSHHIYMSLIIILILTEEEHLTKVVHQIMIKNPTWYTERSLTEISLGGLMVLVITRTVQYNIVRVRDKYLHTNCLAALANMSSEFRNLHPYVAQRLISLYETLSKRKARLYTVGENEHIVNTVGNEVFEMEEHIVVLDEVLRMLLEILNSCLSNQLQNNLNLVYALLHKKNVFTENNGNPTLNNIAMVIGYFSSRLQRIQEGADGDLGVSEVLQVIKKGAEQWSNDRLKKFPDLKFRYVEEDKPEEFFTPYVWGLVSSCGAIYWASECSARALRDLVV